MRNHPTAWRQTGSYIRLNTQTGFDGFFSQKACTGSKQQSSGWHLSLTLQEEARRVDQTGECAIPSRIKVQIHKFAVILSSFDLLHLTEKPAAGPEASTL